MHGPVHGMAAGWVAICAELIAHLRSAAAPPHSAHARGSVPCTPVRARPAGARIGRVDPANIARIFSASGVATDSRWRECSFTKPATVPARRMRASPMITRLSAVSATSFIKGELSSTARPSATQLRHRSRTHFTPSASRPFTGSSSTRFLGFPNSTAAIARRWPMPSENLPALVFCTLASPVRSMTSSTRTRAMLFV